MDCVWAAIWAVICSNLGLNNYMYDTSSFLGGRAEGGAPNLNKKYPQGDRHSRNPAIKNRQSLKKMVLQFGGLTGKLVVL